MEWGEGRGRRVLEFCVCDSIRKVHRHVLKLKKRFGGPFQEMVPVHLLNYSNAYG